MPGRGQTLQQSLQKAKFHLALLLDSGDQCLLVYLVEVLLVTAWRRTSVSARFINRTLASSHSWSVQQLRPGVSAFALRIMEFSFGKLDLVRPLKHSSRSIYGITDHTEAATWSHFQVFIHTLA